MRAGSPDEKARMNGALFSAISAECVDVSEMEALIIQGADVNAVDATGETPLYAACASGESGACRVLLSAGADPLKKARGALPLHAAIAAESFDCVDVLVEVPVGDQAYAEKVRTMLKVEGRLGMLPLHLCANLEGGLGIEFAERLLEAGAEVNAVSRGGSGRGTALLACVARDHVDLMRVLFARGATPEIDADRGVGVMHEAVMRRSISSMQILASAGVSVECCGENGVTPLHRAALFGWEEGIAWLLENGASASRPDKDGKDACAYAKFEAVKSALRAFEARQRLSAEMGSGFRP